MMKSSLFRAVMCVLCVWMCGFFGVALRAEEVLGPMSGVGGIVRETENRVLASTPPAEEKRLAEAEISPANEKIADAKMEAARGKVLGEIRKVEVCGSAEFGARLGVATALEDRLVDASEKTAADVAQAIIEVRQNLIEKGFYLVRIMLAGADAYDSATGTLTVRVEEGRFGAVDIKFATESGEGRWFSKSQIERRFKRIKEGDSFDYTILRSALFEANSHPDLTIDTSIDVRRPMPIEGEGRDRRMVSYADMSLDVYESVPVHLLWEINNYGMEEVEEWQTSLTAQYLNLTKHDDVLTFSPSMSLGGELWSLAGSYMLPHHWWNGGNTTVYGGYSRLDVDDVVPRLDLEGTGWFAGLQHSENIYDTDEHLLAVSLGILMRYMEDRYTANNIRLNERGASILPVSAALSYTAKKLDRLGGRNFATIQFIYNVMNGGDKLDEIWTDAEENYWIARWQLARLQPIWGVRQEGIEQPLHQWILFLKLEGQYTSDNLIPVEKLSLGGYNCLRGYHTRGYLGDWGVYGTAELRTPILVDAISCLWGDRTEKTPIDRLQFVGFCDYGYVAYNDLPSGYDDDEFLASAGVGARLAFTQYSQMRCDFAVPMVDGNNEDDDDYELYVSFQLQF